MGAHCYFRANNYQRGWVLQPEDSLCRRITVRLLTIERPEKVLVIHGPGKKLGSSGYFALVLCVLALALNLALASNAAVRLFRWRPDLEC